MIENKITFCRICEPLCGMIATVEAGRLVSLRHGGTLAEILDE
ncbi:hypothetical protein BH11ACT6_BH11ACT6_50370 [soil metagenome]